MSKNIITVDRDGEDGLAVNFAGTTQERLVAVGATIAAAIASMKGGGTPEETIREQMQIWTDYGLQHGTEQKQAGQATERVEIGYTVDKERWHEAADSIETVSTAMAAYLLQRNLDGKGQEDKDEFLADVALVVTATRYVAEFAADKCRFIPVSQKKNRGDMR